MKIIEKIRWIHTRYPNVDFWSILKEASNRLGSTSTSNMTDDDIDEGLKSIISDIKKQRGIEFPSNACGYYEGKLV